MLLRTERLSMWVIVRSRDDKNRLVYSMLHKVPVSESGGKVKLGSQRAVGYAIPPVFRSRPRTRP